MMTRSLDQLDVDQSRINLVSYGANRLEGFRPGPGRLVAARPPRPIPGESQPFFLAWFPPFARSEILTDCYRRPPRRPLDYTLVESGQKTNTHDTRTTNQSAR